MVDNLNWQNLFCGLSEDDRISLISLWNQESKGDSRTAKWLKDAWEHHVKKLASRMRVRPKFLLKVPESDLIRKMSFHAAGIIKDNDLWEYLFRCFYFNFRTNLMCDFLDALEIPHNAEGEIDDGFHEQPTKEVFINALKIMAQSHDQKQVSHYVRTLLLMGEGDSQSIWLHLRDAWKAVQNELSDNGTNELEADTPSGVEENQTLPISNIDEFTTLDEIIIHQIVASASHELGALSHDKLDDMIQELIELNHHRTRNYFHLGYAESLVFNREPDMKRPELNDERKGWYVCGALVGSDRRGDKHQYTKIFKSHQDIVSKSLESKGYLPVAFSNHLMSTFAAAGEHYFAKKMLKVRLQQQNSVRDFVEGLKIAEHLLHQDSAEQALEYLSVLDSFADHKVHPSYRIQLKRRLAQAKQQLGLFRDAQTSLEEVLQEKETPELFADLGMVKAGIRSIREVHIPNHEDQRYALFKALEKGGDSFKRAIDLGKSNPTNAHYLLAISNYLNFFKNKAEGARKAACEHARSAISGMMSSASKSVYQSSGLLGGAQFVEVCALAHSFDESAASKIANKWECISEDSGSFPSVDLAFLLDGLVLIDGKVAADVAFSIWRYHQDEAWDVFKTTQAFTIILEHARHELLEAVIAFVRNENVASSVRFEMSRELLNGLRGRAVNHKLRLIAEEALDQLEILACKEESLGNLFLENIKESHFYAPFWTEEDALWAQVRISRRYGNDSHCEAVLPRLFYMYRDEKPFMAEQVVEQFRSWSIANETCDELERSLPTRDRKEIEGSPRAVNLVFIGGNETQEKYDESVRRWLEDNLPNVSIHFEHTGWSSNWGREVDRLLNIIDQSHAVIIMQMIRTQLGRTLRKKSTRPWIPCTGTGLGAIKGSVMEAVRVASSMKGVTERK